MPLKSRAAFFSMPFCVFLWNFISTDCCWVVSWTHFGATLLNYVRNGKALFLLALIWSAFVYESRECDARLMLNNSAIYEVGNLKILMSKPKESGNTFLNSRWQFQPKQPEKNIKFAQILRSLSHLAFMFFFCFFFVFHSLSLRSHISDKYKHVHKRTLAKKKDRSDGMYF